MAERKTGSRQQGALADFVGRTLDPALRRRGFQTGDILAHWPQIIGQRLAEATQPEKLIWPRPVADADPAAPVEPATIVIRVDGPVAIEVQHMAPQILERLNVYFGYGAIGKVRFVQAPVRAAAPAKPPKKTCPPDASKAVERQVQDIADDELRQSLAALGRNIAAELNKA